jgi:hypothetical protein
MPELMRLLPWIGGSSLDVTGGYSKPLISPIDETQIAEILECDGRIVDMAVTNAHTAFLAHHESSVAQRTAWLYSAADAVDEIESAIIPVLIRSLGKPRRAASFEAKRAGAFIRTCAAQLPHFHGEVLPLDVTPLGVDRFGFTTRIPYGVVAAVTPYNAPADLLVQKVAPALAMGNSVVAKPSPPGVEVALMLAAAFKKAGVPDGLFAPAAMGLMANNSIKALAVLTENRSELLPNLATAKEQGLPITGGYAWFAIFAPKGTPERIVQKLNAATVATLDNPVIQDRLKTAGAIAVSPDRRSSEYLASYLNKEIEKWGAIIRASGIFSKNN